jgi:hypothetical protein
MIFHTDWFRHTKVTKGGYTDTQTDGRDLLSRPSRWAQCHDFHKDWFRHSKANRGGYRDTQTAWLSQTPTFIFFKIGDVC